MKKYGITFKLVIVKKIKQEYYDYYCTYNNNISIGELGCGLSHLWCLKDIVENKYEYSIIMEDNMQFVNGINNSGFHLLISKKIIINKIYSILLWMFLTSIIKSRSRASNFIKFYIYLISTGSTC